MNMARSFTKRRGVAGVAVVTALVLVTASCGGPSPIPPAEVARKALETSLTAWRDGKTPADTTKGDPPIQVMDSEWTNGRKLASFEIVREQPSDSDKRFVVKLKYANPAAVTETTYIVLGTQPVAVFREEDYTRTLNMDNNPVSKKKR